jgi:hypothetical protein
MHLLIWSAHEGRTGENHKMRMLYGVEGPRFWNTTCDIPAWSGPSLKWNYIIATLRNIEESSWNLARRWLWQLQRNSAQPDLCIWARWLGQSSRLNGNWFRTLQNKTHGCTSWGRYGKPDGGSKDLWWPIHTMCHHWTYPVIQDFTVNGVAQKAGRGERKH